MPIVVDDIEFGQALEICLVNSKELTNDEWSANYGTNDQLFINLMTKRYEEQDSKLVQKYGYKNKNSLRKNMLVCSLESYEKTIVIELSIHTKLDAWENTGDNTQISSSAPTEIIGAAVRFTFTRCKGKGLDVVTKALFPEGVPNSLEEYLESVDPDYKKWLIYE